MTEKQAFVEISSRSAAQLAERYLALWNEPDADRRRRMIAELWTEDGRHILQPPQEIRGIAARPGLAMTAILEARGYEEIEARAASAYEHWVGSEGLSFRGRDDAERRRRQVPLGGGRQGRRGVRSRAQLPRPRRGRPDRARLHVRRRLSGMGGRRPADHHLGSLQRGKCRPSAVRVVPAGRWARMVAPRESGSRSRRSRSRHPRA